MRNNLSPESAPWGRDIESRIRALEGGSKTLAQDSTNALDTQAATLAQMSQQLVDIRKTLSFMSRSTTTYRSAPSDSLIVPAATASVVWKDLLTLPITFASDVAHYATISTPEALVGLSGGSAGLIQSGWTQLRVITESPTGVQTVHPEIPTLRQNLTYNGTTVSTALSGTLRLYHSGGVLNNTLRFQMGGGHATSQSDTQHIVQLPSIVINTVPIS